MHNNSSTFRASYSVLSLWSSGNYEEAVKTYFRLPRFENQAMRDGKRYHEEWSEEIATFSTLPSVFGRKQLVNPITEKKMTCTLTGNEWLEIVGIPDLIDGDTLYEFKTGVASSSVYAKTYQAGIYGILAIKNDLDIRQVVFMRYNQYSKRVDTSYVWMSKAKIASSVEWIVTHSSEMYHYLQENNLYDSYGKPAEVENDDLPADILEVDITIEEVLKGGENG